MHSLLLEKDIIKSRVRHRLAVKELMTPQSLLNQLELVENDDLGLGLEFENPLQFKAEPIRPLWQGGKFTDFKSLLSAREEIRNLRLLPVKSTEDRANYNKIKTSQLENVRNIFKQGDVAYSINEFPYALPPDLEQGIVWVNDKVNDYRLIKFIAGVLHKIDSCPSEAIIFERPRHCDIPLLKGTFKDFRHIHLWTKKKI